MAVRFSQPKDDSDHNHGTEKHPQKDAAKDGPKKIEVGFQRKVSITIRLHPETVAKFKATGKGWQSRISAILDQEAVKL